MTVICLILFLAVSAFWFFVNEYPVLFGIYVPTCALRRSTFKVVVSVALLSAVAFTYTSGSGIIMSADRYVGMVDCQSLMIILLSSLIILLVLKLFSINGSAVYAMLGGFQACLISSGYEMDVHVLLSFISAPVIAFVFSAILRLLAEKTLERCHMHLITLSYYMRFAVMAAIVLTASALGLNWGGFLRIGAEMISGTSADLFVVLAVLVCAILSLSSLMRKTSDENASIYGDFPVYTILAVGLSTAVALFLFSYDFIGLKAVPLAPGSLVFAALAGSEIVKKTRMVEMEEYAKEALAFITAPLGSMVIAYAILHVSGNNEEQLVDFTVMAAAILVLVALSFAGYARRQRILMEATERLVYSQQQQIYENSRALNDMELKVVMSENQALHNAVEMKRQEVMNVALSMVEQKEYLESLNAIVKKLAKSKDEKERDGLISELGASLRQRLSYERDVDSQYFYSQAESLHEDFNAKLSENFPDLTQQERRLATLLRLGFSSKYIATLMNITPKSVEISRYRLRQKLGLSKGDNLVNFIKSI